MIKYKKVLTDSKVFNCLASTMATLCREQELDFELMLLGDWKFSFGKYNGSRIGGLVHKNQPDYYDLLLKYHNIKVTERQISDLKEFKEQFKMPIAEKGFAIVYDTFYCPWVYNYQKEHQKHYSLALGFQEDGKFLCCDTVPYSEQTELPIDDLLQSEFSIVTVEKCDKDLKSHDYSEIIRDIAKTNLGDSGSVKMLVDYAQLVENKFCVEKENQYAGTNFWFRAPFLVDMEWLAHGRATFHLATECLAKNHSENAFFQHVSKQFGKIADDWYIMFLSCWKVFLTPGYKDSDARKEVSYAIRQLALREEQLAKEILNYGGTSNE